MVVGHRSIICIPILVTSMLATLLTGSHKSFTTRSAVLHISFKTPSVEKILLLLETASPTSMKITHMAVAVLLSHPGENDILKKDILGTPRVAKEYLGPVPSDDRLKILPEATALGSSEAHLAAAPAAMYLQVQRVEFDHPCHHKTEIMGSHCRSVGGRGSVLKQMGSSRHASR